MGLRFDPYWVIKPGETLREMLDEAGLKGDLGVRFAARMTGLDPLVVQRIIDGKARITRDIAERLSTAAAPLQISAQFWLNLERAYRRGLAAGKKEL